jgi:hypothetical protein
VVFPHCGWEACGLGKRLVAARPIPQEYDAFTVSILTVNPAEFGKLATRHKLVEIAEARVSNDHPYPIYPFLNPHFNTRVWASMS